MQFLTGLGGSRYPSRHLRTIVTVSLQFSTHVLTMTSSCCINSAGSRPGHPIRLRNRAAALLWRRHRSTKTGHSARSADTWSGRRTWVTLSTHIGHFVHGSRGVPIFSTTSIATLSASSHCAVGSIVRQTTASSLQTGKESMSSGSSRMADWWRSLRPWSCAGTENPVFALVTHATWIGLHTGSQEAHADFARFGPDESIHQ